MLFEPFELKGKTLRNRVVAPPLASSSSLMEGGPSGKSIEIYHKFASAGLGMVILEHHAVSWNGRIRPAQFLCHTDEAAKEHAKIAQMIKNYGSVALVQINHGGSNIADPAVFDMPEYRNVSPSGITVGGRWNGLKQKSYELTESEIKGIVEDFASAAVRMVKIAGYDGVQIHASHGYLLGQFLSPLTNKRTDSYGGTDSKRARLLYEITDAVRQSLPDSIVEVRLGAADFIPGDQRKGLSLDETVPVARELVNLGVDGIAVTGNLCGYGADRADEAYFAPYAARIREAVGAAVPVECTGGIRSARTANRLLRDKVCDLVGVGRLLLKDGGFLAKWKEEL